MQDYPESPPSLHHSPSTSDKPRFPSRESTPQTPAGFSPAIGKRPDKERDHLPWFRKPIDVGVATTKLFTDTTLLEPDFENHHNFPLFGSSPRDCSMAAPIDISVRQTSTSPRGQQASNLTSALQRNSSSTQNSSNNLQPNAANNNEPTVLDSTPDGLSTFETGARPIIVQGNNHAGRRESLSQSLANGLSWGGLSVGSWIRDE